MSTPISFLLKVISLLVIIMISLDNSIYSQSQVQAKSNIARVSVKDFGAKGDGVSNDIPAFEAAKQTLQKQGGGIIYFPVGKYMSDKNGWRVFASNITLQGDGIDKTYLLTPDKTNASGLGLAPYRSAGWNNAPEEQYTYEDSAKFGDMVIRLKSGQDMSAFKRGTIFYLGAGANYYDQDYGEFNIVDHVVGNTLYLTYPLCKNYTSLESAWRGKLLADFIPPAANKTTTAVIADGPVSKIYPYNISFGNELYTVLSMQNNNYIVKNIGKGNRTIIIPSGTKVYKARSIKITPSTAYNVSIKDMTIVGHRKALVLSNSVKTRITNVKFIWYPGADKGGIWLDGDDGRDCIIQDCIAQSDSIIPSQFARSFSDIKVLHSTFTQTSIDFTEFNANCEVANCSFTLRSLNDRGHYSNNSAITTGASTFNVYIHDNIINVYNRSSAISSQPDIQGYPKNSLHNLVIDHNTIQSELCGSAINVIVVGTTNINNNVISGSVSYVFGGTGAALSVDSSLPKDRRNNLMVQSVCSITNNKFKGTTDGFFTREPNNVIIEGNIIERTGDFTNGGNTKVLQAGNIILGKSLNDQAPFIKFILRNNTFIGWNYTAKSINFLRTITKNVDISNNRFINNTGSFKKEKDFTINFSH